MSTERPAGAPLELPDTGIARHRPSRTDPCYDATVFNFGSPKTAGDWIVHIAGAVVAIFLVWWMLRVYVL